MVDPIANVSPPNHFVQLYDADEELLVRNVGRYIAEGLARNEGALIVASPAHREAFAAELESLGVDLAQATESGRLVALDAQQTLDRIMHHGSPDATRFEAALGPIMRDVLAGAPAGTLRAYGEMVGVLWLAGNVTAAIELEEIWDARLASGTFSLLCGYPIDVFGTEFQAAIVDGILCAHSTVLPSTSARFDGALERAIEEVTGPSTIRGGFETAATRVHRAALPKAEATALWVRSSLPRYADEIMDRARLYYKR
jgi:hypothetical protein